MTREEAEQIIDTTVSLVGPRFHLDTPMTEYFGSESNLQAGIDTAMDTLENLGIDPYEIALRSIRNNFEIATDEERSYGPRR